MAAKKYYVVKKGKIPGIYFTWDDCKKMVDGYPGAVYKGFTTLAEAESYMSGAESTVAKAKVAQAQNEPFGKELPLVYAFVDGSFNAVTNVYGYGGFLFYNIL